MPLAELFALEADYHTNRDAYNSTMHRLNHGSPQKSDFWQAAQLNADLQSTLSRMASHVPQEEQFKLRAATEGFENEYERLMSDSSTVATMYYYRYVVWFLVALVLLLIYFIL